MKLKVLEMDTMRRSCTVSILECILNTTIKQQMNMEEDIIDKADKKRLVILKGCQKYIFKYMEPKTYRKSKECYVHQNIHITRRILLLRTDCKLESNNNILKQIQQIIIMHVYSTSVSYTILTNNYAHFLQNTVTAFYIFIIPFAKTKGIHCNAITGMCLKFLSTMTKLVKV